MRSRLTIIDNTIIHYQLNLKVWEVISVPKYFSLGTFLSLQVLCGYISASQTGIDRFSIVI